jgi:hypothetical protein
VVKRGECLIAFANLWLGAGREELSVDLMCHAAGAPTGTLDYLFTELMLSIWCGARATSAPRGVRVACGAGRVTALIAGGFAGILAR